MTKETTTSDLAGNANTALQRMTFLAYVWWCLLNLNLNLNGYVEVPRSLVLYDVGGLR